MTNRLPHSLRSDARDNRERILAVARTTFAEQGLDVAMREIARHAEVGPATLYRHFPTKEVLVTEAFSEQMTACTALVDEGLADPDPWRGFCLVIEKVCEMHARDRGFTAAFVSAFPHAIDFAADREQALGKLAELARRAKATGKLRPDFALDDLIMVLMANGGIRTTSTATAVAASRRFAALLIQGMRAQPAIPPLPPAVRLPLTLEGLDTAARHARRPPPVITDDMLHTVLRRRANGESVEQIQPELIIPTGKRMGQAPSVASIYGALAKHEKREAYPEAVAQAHTDFAALQAGEVPGPRLTVPD